MENTARFQDMFPLRAIAFDLDGTLVDSSHDLTAAINRTRHELQLPPHPRDQVLRMVGDGARKLVQRAMESDCPEESLDTLLERFLVHYSQVCVDRTRSYDGIEELLEEVGRLFPLALLTNKPEAMSRKILDSLGLSHHFRALVGGDTLPTRKPDPAGLLHLAHELQIPAEEWLMVGDSRIDEATAHAAGARFAFCHWGYEPEANAAAVNAEIRARDAFELKVAILGR